MVDNLYENLGGYFNSLFYNGMMGNLYENLEVILMMFHIGMLGNLYENLGGYFNGHS